MSSKPGLNFNVQKKQEMSQEKSFFDEEKQATLAAIVDSSDDAIISKTLDGIITSWNKSAVKMFGYTEEEAIGKHITIIIPLERLDEETLIIESIRAGKKIDHFETIRRTKDGQEKPISLTVSPVKDYRGKITGASKIARDISSKIELEKQQAVYTQKLKDLNKYKDEFIVLASHELKTPLTVILSNLQILEHLSPQNKNTHFLTAAIKQVVKLSGLITELLDVSKIKVGKLTLNKTQFSLDTLLKETGNYLQQTTKNHLVNYNSQLHNIMINGDRDRIEQVMINLISNAIKYTPAGGSIFLDIYREEGKVIVRVSDSGIGIPKEDLENIFQRFYRVSEPAASFPGSGIGLFISAEIIKAHQGSIWAESEINKGSVFYFSIPECEKKIVHTLESVTAKTSVRGKT